MLYPNLCHNRTGSSMIMIQLIILVASSILMIHLSSSITNSAAQTVSIQNKTEASHLISELELILSNTSACTQSFQASALTNGSPIKFFYPGSTTTQLAADGHHISPTWKIESITLENITTEFMTPYVLKKAEIKVQFASLATSGPNSVKKRPAIIPFYFSEVGGVIDQCFGEISPSYLCAKMGAKYDPTKSPPCEPPTLVSTTCSSSHAINTITKSGALSCL